jgi:hypothetical protein
MLNITNMESRESESLEILNSCIFWDITPYKKGKNGKSNPVTGHGGP